MKLFFRFQHNGFTVAAAVFISGLFWLWLLPL